MADLRIRMHESTRRGLSRLAFATLGLAPLAVCVCLALATFLPGYRLRQATAWERSLSDQYGLSFRVAEARCLAPQHYRLSGLRILHPESRQLLGEVGEVKIHWRAGQWVVELSDAQLQFDQLREGWRMIHDWYMCRPQRLRPPAVIRTERLTIAAEDRTFVAADLSMQLFPEADRWGLKATFDTIPAGRQAVAAAANQLLIVRYHDPQLAATEMQLRAGTELPCWLIARLLTPLLSEYPPLGSGHHWETGCFRGVFDVRLRRNQASYYLTQATVSQLQLGDSAASPAGILSGRGELQIAQAKFTNQGLQWAEGTLELGPGRMDARFLQAAGYYLGLEVAQHNPVETVSFDHLAASFRIEPQRLYLVGRLDPHGAIARDARGPLASRIDGSALPLANLAHAMTANHPAWGRQVLAWLPLEVPAQADPATGLRISRNP